MKRLLPALFATALIAAACGSDADSSDSTATTEATSETTEAPAPATTDSVATTQPPNTTPETTAAPEPEVTAAELAARGPYAVGVTTRELPEGGLVEIWYPADDAAAGGKVTYNVRDFLPEGVGDLITEDIDDSFTIEATRDATAGCGDPNRPVQDVWPGIDQAATGFCRWVFGIDADPIGLDESVVTDGVTITSK